MLETMDWGEVPDSDILPTNLYVFTVADVAWEYSQNGKLGLKQQLRCEAPELYKGTNVFNRIYVGSDEDPGADNAETWKRRGGQDIKRFLVGVFGDVAQLTGNVAVDVEATRNATVLCLVNIEVDQKPLDKEGNPNPYVGQERMRFKKWFPPNDAEAMARVGQMDVPAAPKAARAATPAAPQAHKPTPPAPPNGAATPGAPRTTPARTAPPAPPVRPAAPPPPPPRPGA